MKRFWRARFVEISASSLALLIGCTDTRASGSGGGAAEGRADSEVIAACKDLCEVQATGEGCSGEASTDCLGMCDLFADRTGECATRTVESFECKQGITWRCSAGSDQAISTDGLCGPEQDAVSEACE